MTTYLLNFPAPKKALATSVLAEYGHEAVALSLAQLNEASAPSSARDWILVYAETVSAACQTLLERSRQYRPNGTVWLVCASSRPEDVRRMLLSGYNNYVMWSPDLVDFRETVEAFTANAPFPRDFASGGYAFRPPHYWLTAQLNADRLLAILADQAGSFPSDYHYLNSCQTELHGCRFCVCSIRFQMSLQDYFRPDFDRIRNILINELWLHLDEFENVVAPSFGLLKSIIGYQIVCLFYSREPERMAEEIHRFLRDFSNRIRERMDVSLVVGYSRLYDRIGDTTPCYKQIVSNLDQGYLTGERTVCRLDDAISYKRFSNEVDTLVKSNLYTAVENNDFALLIHTLTEACRLCIQQRVVISVAKVTLWQTFLHYAQHANLYLFVNKEFVEYTLYNAIQRAESLGCLQQIFGLVLNVYTSTNAAQPNDDSARMMLVMRYIQKNYCRNISLQSVSEYLALAPHYFCVWFKKVNGSNFSDVVRQHRIEAAKTMLSTTSKRIADIAEEVGYNEVVSFNRAFKKVVGMTAGQYRQLFGTENARPTDRPAVS